MESKIREIFLRSLYCSVPVVVPVSVNAQIAHPSISNLHGNLFAVINQSYFREYYNPTASDSY